MADNSAPGTGDDAGELVRLREGVSRVDEELVALLNKRSALSREIGRLKTDSQDTVFQPFREKEVIRELLDKNNGPMPEEHLRAIYREILSSSRSLQRRQSVAYLGPEGTFSYFAGLHYLGSSADYRPKDLLEDLFRCVRQGEADLGIIPLENSLQGTVGQSLDLFLRYEVFIQAEIFCKISHSLLAPGQRLSDIRVVHSHPQALQQCTSWLSAQLPQAEVVPAESTAAAAERVEGKSGEAAIAHPALAERFDLNVLQTGIEDLPENWTRFLIIGPKMPPPGNRDKTSLLFTLTDKPGSLAGMLNRLAEEEVNMKKLESRPMRGERWQYVFFSDVECDLTLDRYERLLQSLRDNCHNLRILGSYPNGPYLDLVQQRV
ncbi:MAG: prephenate dehydratase [Desulfohalobiaceae bacterium]|nr:prephenate dehydratase [Desulfohalobiaceae bacterium]